jgi:hypothetical protein
MTSTSTRRTRQSGWLGMVAYGAIMLVIAGMFHAMAGLVALVDNDYWLVRSQELVVPVGYTTWGWAQLLLGLLAFAAGVGILTGRTWAMVSGVLIAALSAVANLVFMAAAPTWSAVLIVIDVLVIYALVVHGRQMTPSA